MYISVFLCYNFICIYRKGKNCLKCNKNNNFITTELIIVFGLLFNNKILHILMVYSIMIYVDKK